MYTCKTNIITGDKYRITLLTSRMIRLEYQEEGLFEDRATQTVINRKFDPVSYNKTVDSRGISVETDYIVLNYDGQKPSSYGLQVTMKQTGFCWNYGSYEDNLWGTARTLDEADGYVILQPGLFSKNGFSFHDDSASALIHEDGTISLREVEETDIYIFAFGDDYLGGLKEFYALCGKTPMIPRYALGNWWSRFHKYSEESYLELVDNFEKEEIPLSVAVIDMDWHITEVDPKYGSGWTGYTFNPDLFPNPERFLKKLHEKNLYSTLNVHPADGIRAFEVMYPVMAKQMGIDPDTEQAIEFDMTSEEYRKAFFECVNHMYEDMGVDFWWLDWQQGTKSKMEGVDPLWLLNHYYYMDMKDSGKRPMIFSRYAGVGSHRYPIGFSGDTFTTYRSLHFQPHFTLTSSNIGYGWWSHDICGHMHGERNLDMMMRWLQFGIFSPIMRLHSSANPFFIKEPWNLPLEYRNIMKDCMCFRHRLIPYIYTMNYRASHEDIPLIEPMYYRNQADQASYEVFNEYYFGSELIVSPITEPESELLQMAGSDTLIPDGQYYDIFTGQEYHGRSRHKLYRNIKSIPVLLKAGGILPLDVRGMDANHPVCNDTKNPEGLELLLGYGANGSFTLYEDDSVSNDYLNDICVTTGYQLTCDESTGDLTVEICKAQGQLSLVNSSREYYLTIYGLEESAITVNGETVAADKICWNNEKHTLTIAIGQVVTAEGTEIHISGLKRAKIDIAKQVFDILKEAKMEYDEKERIYYRMKDLSNTEELVQTLKEMPWDDCIKNAIDELTIGGMI